MNVNRLIPAVLARSPVWEFALDLEEETETVMRPVLDLPARSLGNRLAGLKVCLANGDKIWGLLGNVDLSNASMTRQFLAVSIFIDDGWFHLARYFDPMQDEYGPNALSLRLGLDAESVFPIAYDLSAICSGNSDVLTGVVPREPVVRLTSEERLALMSRSWEV